MSRGTVQLSGVDFAYGERQVLTGLELNLAGHQTIGLIGPNGAGKSTLLRLLLGLLGPDAGGISMFGHPLASIRRRALARLVTLVPQDAELNYAFTAQEVVAMGRNPWLSRFQPPGARDVEIIREAMRNTDVLDLAERPVTQLSGGERQRVLIARAIAQQTPVVLLDEPTASLDICHQLEVLEFMHALADSGRLVVAAIHDLALASRYCDRLVLLAEGTVRADGPAAAVLTEENLLRYFNLRARVSAAAPGERGLVLSGLQPATARGGAAPTPAPAAEERAGAGASAGGS
ncbi:MAG: ABC transporter ATP-binding protein [Pseudomonadota bacterium]